MIKLRKNNTIASLDADKKLNKKYWNDLFENVLESKANRKVWDNINIDYFGLQLYDKIKQFIPKQKIRILETGMGSGRICLRLAKEFPNSKVVGIDFSKMAIRYCNQSKKALGIKNCIFKYGDITNLNIHDDYFDITFNSGVIEHYKNPIPILREMVRVTKKAVS